MTIQHVHADLEQHAVKLAAHGKRADLVWRLKNINGAFEKLAYHLEASSKQLDVILPSALGETLGRLLALGAWDQLMQTPALWPVIEKELLTKLGAEQLDSLQAVDFATSEYRAAFGMRDAAKLLPELVNALHRPIKKFVELEKLNKGGRPGQLARNWLIHELARNAPAIIGKKANSTANGRFARLCTAVVEACGLPTGGLDKAVEHVVKKMRAPQRAPKP